MKRVLRCLSVGVLAFFLMNVHVASAGFLDKLNDATKKLNDYNAKKQSGQSAGPSSGADEDHPLTLKGQGHCKGQNSATCMDYMEVAGQCMEPLKGYRMKVTGDLIDKKLKNEQLNEAQRKNLQEDLAGIRDAQKAKSDNPTIAGEKNSQRYLRDISEEDQVYINAEYGQFYKKIYNKCMGADHMGVGHRTEMMSDVDTMSGEEAVAKLKEKRAKEEEPFNCLKGVNGLRYTVMAEMMEQRLTTLKLSDKERADWEADIASLREAAQAGGTAMPKPVDPSNPYRAMTRLTSSEDQMAMGTEVSKRSQAIIAECSAKGEKRNMGGQVKSGGLVDKSKSPANKNAKPQTSERKSKVFSGTGGGSLSAALGATKLDYLDKESGCHDAIKGRMAKITADTLEAKLKAASNVPPQKRTEWQEDIAAWRAAEKAGANEQTPPDPSNPYRWQDYLTKEERQKINQEFSAFSNKIVRDCANKDHMGVHGGK